MLITILGFLMMSIANINNSNPEKYLGSYFYTEDFRFQEEVRKLDIALYDAVKDEHGKNGEIFFYNGWSDIITAAYLLEKNPQDIKISKAFAQTIKDEIKKSLEKARVSSNPFIEVSVRDNSKAYLMYPHASHFIPFQRVEIEEPIHLLNQYIKRANSYFEYFEGCEDLCFIVDDIIFDKLWAGDFSTILEKAGYVGFDRSIFRPHISLIRSDDLPKIKELFYERFGRIAGEEEFETYFSSFVEKLNAKLKEDGPSLTFAELASTYSEDYAPYEQVIVAKFKMPLLEKTLSQLFEELDAIFQKRPNFSPEIEGLHLTLAIRFREKSNDLENVKMEEVLKETGPFKEELEFFWNTFKD